MSLMLRIGSNGNDVRKLQTVLNYLHSTTPLLQTDGIFGPKTHGAVVHLQKAAHISVDGIVGPITAKALLSAVHGTVKTRKAFFG
ncbi:MAG: peptidoglycan-binding domain-containing protein [Chloroflexota bacterium]|nr:peptidoglycan-binding domain-containing protein [Chloroflexota bacterium]